MADMGIWKVLPLPEEDQVVPHTLESEDHYDPWMLVPPSPIQVEKELDEDDEPFEEEKTLEEEESLEEANNKDPVDSSPYPNSSSSDDPADHVEAEVQVEDETIRESDLKPLQPMEVLSSTPSPSHQLFRLRITGPC